MATITERKTRRNKKTQLLATYCCSVLFLLFLLLISFFTTPGTPRWIKPPSSYFFCWYPQLVCIYLRHFTHLFVLTFLQYPSFLVGESYCLPSSVLFTSHNTAIWVFPIAYLPPNPPLTVLSNAVCHFRYAIFIISVSIFPLCTLATFWLFALFLCCCAF